MIRVPSRSCVVASLLVTALLHIHQHILYSRSSLFRQRSQEKPRATIGARFSSISGHPRATIHQPELTTVCSCSALPAAFWPWPEQLSATVSSSNLIAHLPRPPRSRRGWPAAAYAVLTQEFVKKAFAAPEEFVPHFTILAWRDTDVSGQGVCGTGGEYCSAPGCQLSYGPACHGNIVPKGADTSKTPRPHFGNVPYGIDLRSCTIPGTIALTFDDGPYHYTNDLLDVLSKNGVRVTFFVTGVNGAKGPINEPSTGQPDTLRRMITEGHQIAGHSWSHEDMESITLDQKHEQIIKNEIALADVFGFFPTYYRPPYTGCGVDCIAELGTYGYHVVCLSP